jgi:glycosyltransferase involved in cell wall biosynthesis
MKKVIVHDWLVTYAGSEKVLEQILLIYPDADLFSLVDFITDDERGFILNKKATTSFLQWMPFARKNYRSYLPLMPFAIERFDLSGYDLIISSSHAFAKSVRRGPGQVHVCYCHTPMRYIWDLKDQYLREVGLELGLRGVLARALLNRLRKFDVETARTVDHFIANSGYIRNRIQRIYGRDAFVIYPPVDVKGFPLCREKEDFYLTASRMVPYKKIGLIVDAFTRMPEYRLVVIGNGPDFKKISMHAGKNVRLLGYQPPDVMSNFMGRARAFLFAADEDFGITPVEAQACGTPVIAYRKGGVLETVIENMTGLFFDEQEVQSVIDSVKRFEKIQRNFDPLRIRENALRFGQEHFRHEFLQFMECVLRGVKLHIDG